MHLGIDIASSSHLGLHIHPKHLIIPLMENPSKAMTVPIVEAFN